MRETETVIRGARIAGPIAGVLTGTVALGACERSAPEAESPSEPAAESEEVAAEDPSEEAGAEERRAAGREAIDAEAAAEDAIATLCPEEPCECPGSRAVEGVLEVESQRLVHLRDRDAPELVVGARGCGEVGRGDHSVIVFTAADGSADEPPAAWELEEGWYGFDERECQVAAPEGTREVLVCPSAGIIRMGYLSASLVQIAARGDEVEKESIATFSYPAGGGTTPPEYRYEDLKAIEVTDDGRDVAVIEAEVDRAFARFPETYAHHLEAKDDGWEPPEPERETDMYPWTDDGFQPLDASSTPLVWTRTRPPDELFYAHGEWEALLARADDLPVDPAASDWRPVDLDDLETRRAATKEDVFDLALAAHPFDIDAIEVDFVRKRYRAEDTGEGELLVQLWNFRDDALAGQDYRGRVEEVEGGYRLASLETLLRCRRGVTDDGVCL